MQGQKRKECGEHKRNDAAVHTLLNESAGPGIHRSEQQKLYNAVQRRSGSHGAKERFSQLIKPADDQRMKDGMGGEVFARGILVHLVLEVIGDDAGPKSQQDRTVA